MPSDLNLNVHYSNLRVDVHIKPVLKQHHLCKYNVEKK